MSNDTGLIWLASYPKSGNTWTRIFLNHLFNPNNENFNLNYLQNGTIASAWNLVEDALGIDICELNQDEIDLLRPAAYQQLAVDEAQDHQIDTFTSPQLHKVHDAFSYLPNGTELFPSTATRCSIVLVRNPLDIAISYANHNNCSIEKSVDALCDNNNAFCGNQNQFHGQLRQHLWRWSEHVSSWLDADIPKMIIRYEDLKHDSVKQFTRLCQFLQLRYSDQEISAAVEASEFEKLRELEIKQGFREKGAMVKSFFRKGIIGEWQSTLSEQQVEKIIQHNAPSMRRLGYLNEHNEALIQPLPLDPSP